MLKIPMNVCLDILPLEIAMGYQLLNESEDQQIELIKAFKRYLELQDELTKDPRYGLPGLCSDPVRLSLDPPERQGGAMIVIQLDNHPLYTYHQAIKPISF